MPVGQTIRVRIAAPTEEARRLCTRLTRGGIPAAPDDGTSRAEVLVAVQPEGDLAPIRARAGWLVVLGAPGAAYFAAGADDVVVSGEPEVLFRRLRAALERFDLLSRIDRLNERVVALEAGLADAAHDVRSPLQAVIGNAERGDLGDIAERRRDLTERARANRLQPADITGTTFTISNLGMFQVDAFTAIIVPPQAGILAVGALTDRVVPVPGGIGVRPMLSLTLSCDHRVVDGARGAAFLNDVVVALQEADKRLT